MNSYPSTRILPQRWLSNWQVGPSVASDQIKPQDISGQIKKWLRIKFELFQSIHSKLLSVECTLSVALETRAIATLRRGVAGLM